MKKTLTWQQQNSNITSRRMTIQYYLPQSRRVCCQSQSQSHTKKSLTSQQQKSKGTGRMMMI
eukprot:913071-Ditylum_brightwellii.AAC.1